MVDVGNERVWMQMKQRDWERGRKSIVASFSLPSLACTIIFAALYAKPEKNENELTLRTWARHHPARA